MVFIQHNYIYFVPSTTRSNYSMYIDDNYLKKINIILAKSQNNMPNRNYLKPFGELPCLVERMIYI